MMIRAHRATPTPIMANIAYRLARRIAVTVVGFTVLAIGIAMIALPGPAFIVIPAGLGILGLEFAWARRWLQKVKEKAEAVAKTVTGSGDSTAPKT
jgi:tellurite resistance protein TerC